MDSFKTKDTFTANGKTFAFVSLPKLQQQFPNIAKLPYSIKILIENLLRNEDGLSVTAKDIQTLIDYNPKNNPPREISFMPTRVLLQDFTGVPAVVDLAAMRDALQKIGADPKKINPFQEVELVIDHSVQVDYSASKDALEKNTQIEFQRNAERYAFLKWGQSAFEHFKVVPPSTGIVHQVNLEYLARVVMERNVKGELWAFLDTLVGTDSHTTMINGLGVLGWGVGGIEAEAGMLGQPTTMLIPDVVGFCFTGELPKTTTATDLVLTVTQMLRKKGVVGKFVEFFGPGLKSLSLADRATVANMAPEYGATCGIFGVDQKTIDYLRLTGRSEEQIELIETYYKKQNLFDHTVSENAFNDVLSLDLSTVVPSVAGPKRPQDRLSLLDIQSSFEQFAGSQHDASISIHDNGQTYELASGSVVIAAITSCTNTSNPSVLLAAGLLAKKASEKGLSIKPWVKTSLAPGSRVVMDYLDHAGLTPYLENLGFHCVGFGCTTCIGNSGPLRDTLSQGIDKGALVVASVLSGNRNFEGRVHAKTKANYLASPPLVVAFALAGNVKINFETDPLGLDLHQKPVFLKDLWPSHDEIQTLLRSLNAQMFKKSYAHVFEGDELWKNISSKQTLTYPWDPSSTYIRRAPFFDRLDETNSGDIGEARVLAFLGDSITTDHISPAGNISAQSPAAIYLKSKGVEPKDFNSYGARRGNHEVMVRGTFANIRLQNKLTPQTEGGVTFHFPSQKQMSIFDASELYQQQKIPLIILAGKEYGTGSSRDWAAKGPKLLGVKAVIAESFERIHRSNLIGMGILPLEFMNGQSAVSLGLTGAETFSFTGVTQNLKDQFRSSKIIHVIAKGDKTLEFDVKARIDTPQESLYYENDGILPYVLKNRVNA